MLNRLSSASGDSNTSLNTSASVTGTPGGKTIINTTMQTILNVIDHDMNIARAVSAARIHHQWLPDELRLERGFSPDTVALLRDKGHAIRVDKTMGSTQSVSYKDGVFYGASDPRRRGSLTIALPRQR